MMASHHKHGSWLIIFLITLHFSSQGNAYSCYEGTTEDGTNNPNFPTVKHCDSQHARAKRDIPSPSTPTPLSVDQNATASTQTLLKTTATSVAPTDQSATTTEVPIPPARTKSQSTSSPVTTKAPSSQMCVRFQVQKTQGTLIHGEDIGWKVQYGCDTDNLCQGIHSRGTVDHEVTWHGENGTLYCCSNRDNCNTPVVQSCYSGQAGQRSPSIVKDGGEKGLSKTSCSSDAQFCVSSLVYVNGTQVGGQYSCSMVDNKDVCVRHGFTQPGCKNSTGPSGKRSTVCCCNTNNCNAPDNHSPSPSVSPKQPGAHHINYAIPTAATVIIIVVILTAVGGLCVWKKKRENGRGALSFTYSRLAADVAV